MFIQNQLQQAESQPLGTKLMYLSRHDESGFNFQIQNAAAPFGASDLLLPAVAPCDAILNYSAR